jgi:BNR/Asp-box repeat protein
MTSVRVLVGTKKGGFLLTSDAKRQKWDVSGPLFGGWEIYHMKGSPVDPNRIYASQSSGWFGQIIQRSDDGGKTWTVPGTPGGLPKNEWGMPMGEANKFVYDPATPITTHQHFDGTQKPWKFTRVWNLQPSPSDPNTVYAGVEDAGLFKSTDGGTTWHELHALRAAQGEKWSPGAGGMGLHTILLDKSNPNRIYIAISAAGAFRTDDGGKTWKPINKGLRNDYLPDPAPEIGFCVHKMAMHPSRSNTVYMQLHGGGGILRTDNAGDLWKDVRGNLPTDFGFPIDVHAHEPETIYCIPISQMPARTPPENKLRVFRSRKGGNEWEPLTKGLPQENCFVNVLREAMAVDSLDSCGVYFGTTGGQVYCSPDSGDSWAPIVRDLPTVLSVEVQTLN